MPRKADSPRALIERAQEVTGLTQAQLAEVLGVRPTALRMWISEGKYQARMQEPIVRQLMLIIRGPASVRKRIVEIARERQVTEETRGIG